jgi:hypothetical protein
MLQPQKMRARTERNPGMLFGDGDFRLLRSVQPVQRDAANTPDADCACASTRQVDRYMLRLQRNTIVNAHRHRPTILQVDDAQPRIERQGLVRGSQPVRVKLLAAGCAAGMLIPGRSAGADRPAPGNRLG